jgi:hypothetical protein
VLLNYQNLPVARAPDHCRDWPYKPKVTKLGIKLIVRHHVAQLDVSVRCMRGSIYLFASVEVVYGCVDVGNNLVPL